MLPRRVQELRELDREEARTVKDGVHLAQLPISFGEQMSESTRAVSDAHIVWQDTNTVEPVKRQCVAKATTGFARLSSVKTSSRQAASPD